MKILYSVLLFFLFASSAFAGSSATGPEENGKADTILSGPIRFYQQHISSADGNRCPMDPSCSSYAMEAVHRHGAIMGWIMTCDRLLRCGRDEQKNCSRKMTRHGIRCADSVDNNDFWWQ